MSDLAATAREVHGSEPGAVEHADVDVSVVLTCYTEDRIASIRSALASLRAQSLRPRAVVIAVDNNAPLARRLEDEFDWAAVVVNDGQRGASATRNCGAAGVDTQYTAFLDDDEVADQDWLLALTRPFDQDDVVGTGGKYEPAWSSAQPAWFPDEFGWVVGGAYEGMPTGTAPVRNVWSGNMAVRTAALRQVGGFRADFGKRGSIPQPEDTDFCIRVSDATDGQWMYVPSAVVFHQVPPQRESLTFFASRCYAEGAGKALLRRHLEPRAIEIEHDYVRATAVAALRRLLLFNSTALMQALAMLLGLASAGVGYARALLTSVTAE
jgi:GT2 family glycosyltransferase